MSGQEGRTNREKGCGCSVREKLEVISFLGVKFLVVLSGIGWFGGYVEILELMSILGLELVVVGSELVDLGDFMGKFRVVSLLGVKFMAVGSEVFYLEPPMEIMAPGHDTYTPLGKQTLEIPLKSPQKIHLKPSLLPAVQLRL